MVRVGQVVVMVSRKWIEVNVMFSEVMETWLWLCRFCVCVAELGCFSSSSYTTLVEFSFHVHVHVKTFDFEHIGFWWVFKESKLNKKEVSGIGATIMSTVCVSQQPSRELINKEGGRMRNSPQLTATALLTPVQLHVMRVLLWICFSRWLIAISLLNETEQKWQNRTQLLMLPAALMQFICWQREKPYLRLLMLWVGDWVTQGRSKAAWHISMTSV